tara:strand:- start:529 stop:771 length:243 start_codon:yes stop_codon:yes gene_type:complete
MEYTTKDINTIFGFTSWTDKRKIDELLRLDAQMYCNLGTDSTAFERTEVKKISKSIYQIIKKIDKPTGDMFLHNDDNLKK